MASARILVAVAVLSVGLHDASTASSVERVAVQAKLGGMTEACKTRGLPSPCSVACSMSARLCRACCAAVATFTTAPSSASSASSASSGGVASSTTVPDIGPVPSDEDILTKGIAKSANCLAQCSSFPAKQIRAILKDPKANEGDLKELTKQMTALNADLPWATILENGNSRPLSISVLCENGKLAC